MWPLCIPTLKRIQTIYCAAQIPSTVSQTRAACFMLKINTRFWVLTERVTEDKCWEPAHNPSTTLRVSKWMSWDRLGLRLTHTYAHTKCQQCIRLSQTRRLYPRRDVINVKRPNSQLHSSPSFPLLVDFLWVSLCSESVNTAAPHGESPELLYKATFFLLAKVGQAPASLLLRAEGCAEEWVAHPSLFARPIHNSHSPTGN